MWWLKGYRPPWAVTSARDGSDLMQEREKGDLAASGDPLTAAPLMRLGSSLEIMVYVILMPKNQKKNVGGGEAYCKPTEVLSLCREGVGRACGVAT